MINSVIKSKPNFINIFGFAEICALQKYFAKLIKNFYFIFAKKCNAQISAKAKT